MCRRLAPIERETLEKLGEEKGSFFISASFPELCLAQWHRTSPSATRAAEPTPIPVTSG